MRSSNLKHCKCKRKQGHICSLIVSVAVAVSSIVIPSSVMILNVHAVTSNDASQVVATEKVEESTQCTTELVEVKEKKQNKTNLSKKTEKATKAVVKETEPIQTNQVEEVEVSNEYSGAIDYNYTPEYVALSDYDRDLLERLVTGEAASLGFDGCALVAQAVRDTMVLSGTTSVEKIIKDYKYTGSTNLKATQAAKDAVSFIFDQCGYAVQHRIIYFYAEDIVSSPWHETQNYVTSCANVRFFDQA